MTAEPRNGAAGITDGGGRDGALPRAGSRRGSREPPALAIHHRPGSFSDRWIALCRERSIPHAIVDGLSSGVIAQLSGARALLWHWHHQSPAGVRAARAVIAAAEAMGVVAFPDARSAAHFDDKIAQKYLLEAVGAPLAPAHVFYDLPAALRWIDAAEFPKVFKLARGAGAANVALVRDRGEARRLARRAFGPGFAPVQGYLRDLGTRARSAAARRSLLAGALRLPRTLAAIRARNSALGRERGYVYFQDLVPGSRYDIRVVVVGRRALAYTRNVRGGDFRASGSGDFDFRPERIPPAAIAEAFRTTRALGARALALDLVLDPGGRPLILEVSYGFGTTGLRRCEAHVDDELRWHPGGFRPEDAILLDVLGSSERGAGPRVRAALGPRGAT
jgi:glutathione synthase/RimK-type ligase-like ATP-grasp enzyme